MFLVIHILDKIGNPFLDILHGSVFPQLDHLGFEGFDKTLSIGIIIGIAFSAHADLKTIGLKLFEMLTRGILDTTV